jgi:NAD-dependent deacetylase
VDLQLNESIERAADALVTHGYVVCLTGAGMSVESGIRPFRGPGGVWTEHGEPPLDDYRRFVSDPVAYWKRLLKPVGYLQELYLALERAQPNEGHRALVELERRGIIRYVITQNIDGLHRRAGNRKVAEIHGNYAMLRCVSCGTRFERQRVDTSLLPPICPICGGIVKDDVVVFGEPIPEDTGLVCAEQTDYADCMLLVGTSAYVYPAAAFPQQVKQRGGTLIEVGPHPTEITEMCDIVVRGTAAEVLPQLAQAVADRLAAAEAKSGTNGKTHDA